MGGAQDSGRPRASPQRSARGLPMGPQQDTAPLALRRAVSSQAGQAQTEKSSDPEVP